MMLDFFKISFLSLKHRSVRSWLTIVGIVIGIAAIVALISISQGLENAIVEQFSKMGVQDIRVVPKGMRGPPGSSSVSILSEDDVDVVEKVKGVDYVLGILSERAVVEFGNEEQRLNVIAYPTDLAERAFLDVDIEFSQGRAFSENEMGSVIVGHNIADNVFDKEVRLRNNINIEDKNFKVIGIFEELGVPTFDDSLFMALDDARDMFDEPDKVSAITVHILPGMDMNDIAEDIDRKLERARDDENFDVFTPQQILNQMSDILGIVEIVLAGIAAISLLVGGIGIMNSMYTSVLERTGEIGVMKAIGATNNNILTMFLLESGLIGLVGGLAGVGIGTGIAFSFGGVAGLLGFSLLSIKINFQLLAFALAFAFFVGMISGTLPAVRASKLKPVDALRYE